MWNPSRLGNASSLLFFMAICNVLASTLLMSSVTAETMRVYIGTYTDTESSGIYVGEFDPETGRIGEVRLAGETSNPSFLALHPTEQKLYSVSEASGEEGQTGEPSIHAWRIDEHDGALTVLSRVSSRGLAPCHLAISKDGNLLAAANYGTGSIVAYRILSRGDIGDEFGFGQHEGHGEDPNRQNRPHAHSVQFDNEGRFLLSADLGTDELRVYEVTASELVPYDPPVAKLAGGAGPRHFTFSKDGKRVYVINELDGTISSFRFRGGRLEPMETVEMIPGAWREGFSGAEILIHPDGRYLYASVRGGDAIVSFEIDESSGRLNRLRQVSSGGKAPRNFRISPSGRWLLAANQDSDSVVVFRIDPASGSLEPTGQSVKVAKPVCIQFHQT